ncbi:MAG: xanthine dehydrogenase molybdopterin binding subunit [Burkholderiaceae bacterium]|nr:xanthine dehydrogenase molybdopterin binding subunit [Burkholderiaceae bacterium]
MNSKSEAFMTIGAAKGWAEVGQNHPHESAILHVLGEATYTDDIPEAQGTLHAALGMSPKAHARIVSMNLDPVRAMPGVVDVLTYKDIPGTNDCGPIIHDDPILAEEKVEYVGQPMFVVIAKTHDQARHAARKADIQWEELPAILTPEAARDAQSFVVPPMRLERGNAAEAFKKSKNFLKGTLHVGGQEQFYLEGQISYALPKEGNGMHVYCSTQHPTEMQHVVAHALHYPSHAVQIECRRMGGGFGGKESQSALWAACAAVAAAKLRRPVKLRADRDDDMMVTGKRHCFYYEYEMGYDDNGLITAAKVEMVSRAGFSADLSAPVATRAVCHFDNTYYLSDVDIRAMAGKTNTQSNTAFRGFGGPQGAIAIEYIVDEIARNLGIDQLDVRKVNFYGRNDEEGRNVTQYGQKIKDNVIHELVAQLETESNYRARRKEVDAFNATSPVLKKGLAITPVKFGIAFNVTHFNQAGALVHIYTDGSVLVNHGGTEMGQGINTKVCQVVAHELGIPLARVRASATDTSKVANTSATAASTGADLNGKAAQDAAATLNKRLRDFAAKTYSVPAEEIVFAAGIVYAGDITTTFAELVAAAYLARVQLWSDGFYATPGLSWDRASMTGNPFGYYAYGASVSEVIVDTLTGEWKLLDVNALYDAGNSLNPAIDVGQVEGAFIQGMGWLTTEELWWNKTGKLMTHAPSTYKIPAVSDCPDNFDIRLFKNRNPFDSIHRSKAVGEPPLLLPFSVFLAIRNAVSSVGEHKINPPLRAPATSEAILDAVEAVKAQLAA